MSWEGRTHFVGIGGAGMSAIAKVLLERGLEVSGSDLKGTATTSALEGLGAEIRIGHDDAVVDGAARVVVSAAIDERNPEVVRARELDLEVISRGRALAHLLAGLRSIVVAGTHGKTTTTSMIVSILHAAGRDPTYLVGGGLNDAGTNASWGREELAVAESDESDASFLLLDPSIAVVTNIEMDHVDHWSSLDELRAAFASFLARVDEDGVVVLPYDDDLIEQVGGRRVFTFGGTGDITAEAPITTREGTRFTIVEGAERAEVMLSVPGEHNVLDALAAAGAARAVGVPLAEIAAGLGAFSGVQRRFEIIGERAGVTVVDDYAHHPAEVRATLEAARAGEWSRVIAVFQPHRYSRTRALGNQFGPAFAGADKVVITDVYGAGEAVVPGVTGKLISDAVADALPGRSVAYLPHRADLASYLAAVARSGDVVLTLGAGDITSLGPQLLDALEAGS